MMTRAEVLRKCLIVFDALRRVSSKGNAGLEALPGVEESFRADAEICQVLREWLREMEAGAQTNRPQPLDNYSLMELLKGNALFTPETLEAARRVDEARDKIIDQIGRPEPDVPKVVDLREWQKLAAKKPPERLDFDE